MGETCHPLDLRPCYFASPAFGYSNMLNLLAMIEWVVAIEQVQYVRELDHIIRSVFGDGQSRLCQQIPEQRASVQ